MILKNGLIVAENGLIQKGWIETDGKLIVSINSGETEKDGIDLKNHVILPGFIDIHTHGGYGVDFETATLEGFDKYAKNVAKEGVTKFCQATVTGSDETVINCLKVYAEYMANHNNGAKAIQVGAHIEGPFISPARKGAHKLALLQKPTIKIMQKYIEASNNNIRVLTFAAEEAEPGFLEFLKKNNVLASCGHSNITYEEFRKIQGTETPITHVTHLYNGMSGFEHRAPGLATAAQYYPNVFCEIISDGIHVAEPVVNLTLKMIGYKRLVLVTDSINAKGMPNGPYKLGPLDVVKTDDRVLIKGTTTPAGSVSTYDNIVRHFMIFAPTNWSTLTYVTSINAAKQLNIYDKTGSLKVGKLADITVLDCNKRVVLTISEGVVAFNNLNK